MKKKKYSERKKEQELPEFQTVDPKEVWAWNFVGASWKRTFMFALGWVLCPVMAIVSRLLKRKILWRI